MSLTQFGLLAQLITFTPYHSLTSHTFTHNNATRTLRKHLTRASHYNTGTQDSVLECMWRPRGNSMWIRQGFDKSIVRLIIRRCRWWFENRDQFAVYGKDKSWSSYGQFLDSASRYGTAQLQYLYESMARVLSTVSDLTSTTGWIYKRSFSHIGSYHGLSSTRTVWLSFHRQAQWEILDTRKAREAWERRKGKISARPDCTQVAWVHFFVSVVYSCVVAVVVTYYLFIVFMYSWLYLWSIRENTRPWCLIFIFVYTDSLITTSQRSQLSLNLLSHRKPPLLLQLFLSSL